MQTIVELTDENYVEFMEKHNSTIFIDFYGDGCAPCQTLMSYLPMLVDHFKDENVLIAKVNAGENKKLSNKYMVRSVPLTVVIGEDKMVKQAEVGLRGIDTYIKMVEKALGKRRGFFSKLFG
jgi:thioredoxin 1